MLTLPWGGEAEATKDGSASLGLAGQGQERYAVLLFYQYAKAGCELPRAMCEALKRSQLTLCLDLGLLGRVRIAREGLNVTLGGTLRSVRRYIAALIADALYAPLEPGSIHFKVGFLVEDSPIPYERQKLTSLSVKLTKEVVSLDVSEDERQQMLAAGPGRLLSPEQFHAALVARGDAPDKVAVIDVRNSYETRIGRFEGALDPGTRQFSDFARWADARVDMLRAKDEVLMYCTGGVRCERASAYLRARGVSKVSQLHGGIQNYQDAFPDGGLFRGKNFVFDNRIAVPYPRCVEVVGCCARCARPWDDYSGQRRCARCRVLLLVCDQCSAEDGAEQLCCEGCERAE